MRRLEELIEKLCPDGVDFSPIKDICSITRGRVMSKDYIAANAGNYPVYSSQTNNNGEFGRISTFDFNGNFVTWTTDGANAGTIFYREGKFSITNVCGLLKADNSKILTKYLYYALSVTARSYVNEGMGNPKLMSNVMAEIIIPVPPLEVQSEIVRILDNFTELTAELTARKQQYEYYRDGLFIMDEEDSPKVKLNTVADIYDGTHQTPDYKTDGVPFISVENINNIYGSKKFISKEAFAKYKIKPQIDDVFMTRIGSIGKCAVFDHDADIAYYVSLALIRPKKNLVRGRYLKYVIESGLGARELHKRTLVNAVPIKVNKDDIGKIEIPLPSLAKQDEIIRIMDKFDTLCNDLSSGLPAEIEARQQQYEYYRDKLLAFKRRSA